MPSLVVRYLPPNPNQTRGLHWAQMARIKQESKMRIYAAVYDANKAGQDVEAKGRRAIMTMNIKAHGKPDDPDNRLARMKPLIDSLVQMGVLTDDSPAHLELAVPTREPGKKGAPEIHINIEYQDAA